MSTLVKKVSRLIPPPLELVYVIINNDLIQLFLFLRKKKQAAGRLVTYPYAIRCDTYIVTIIFLKKMCSTVTPNTLTTTMGRDENERTVRIGSVGLN